MIEKIVEVSMRKLEEGWENIEVLKKIWGKVDMWIEIDWKKKER